MEQFVRYMRGIKLSEVTIAKRVETLARLRRFLTPTTLLEASGSDLFEWQANNGHLAPASLHVYTRHVRQFYRWAVRAGLIGDDPSVNLELPRIPKALPHPTSHDDLRTALACSVGRLHTAYVLATFAGLRCGEICRLRSTDITYDPRPFALVTGKGNKQRRVPLLDPVMSEIGYRRGWLITRDDGRPMPPQKLSNESTNFLQSLGLPTTLHSMRAAFATAAHRMTHDPLLVRDLLGHDSVKTTEIYMETDVDSAHDRLGGFTDFAASILRPRHLSAVENA